MTDTTAQPSAQPSATVAPADNQEGNINAVFSSVRTLLTILGTVLAGHGFSETGLYYWVELSSATIMIVGPAGWGVYSAISTFLKKRQAVAVGVQAGINLTLSNKALDIHGSVIPVEASPPAKPVTIAAAQEIVKQFGTGDGTQAKI